MLRIGGSRGACRAHAPPTGPNSFIFAYISAEKRPCRRSTPPPPTGNPGSATATVELLKLFLIRTFFFSLEDEIEDRKMKQQQFIHVSNLGYAAWYFTRTYRTKCDIVRVIVNITDQPGVVREEPLLECKFKFASWSHSGWELQVNKCPVFWGFFFFERERDYIWSISSAH